MNDVGVVRVQLSKAALHAFLDLMREQWRWVLGFTVIWAFMTFGTIQDSLQLISAASSKISTEVLKSQMQEPSGKLVLIAVLKQVFGLIVLYCFTVFTLKKQPVKGRSDFSRNNILYWLQMILLPFFIYNLSDLFRGGFNILHPEITGASFRLKIELDILVGFVSAYFLVRFMLVVPLAANLIKKPLAVSWNLTKANWWRLVWNYCVYSFVILLMAIAIMAAPLIYGVLHNIDPAELFATAMVVSGAVSFGIVGICISMPVFLSVACLVLYQEKLHADPSFVMERRLPE